MRTVNITDEEKENQKRLSFVANESNRPFLDMVLSALDCIENDYMALLALCLIYALANNKGEYICIFFTKLINLLIYLVCLTRNIITSQLVCRFHCPLQTIFIRFHFLIIACI